MHLLVFAPLAAGLGAVLGLLAARDHPFLKRHGHLALVVLVATAVIAALMPNLGQSLYDLGLSFPQIELLQAVSYLVFGFTVTASWILLLRSPARWLLLALLPVSFAQPPLWAYAFPSWSILGFAH
jgi:hypothetical protein